MQKSLRTYLPLLASACLTFSICPAAVAADAPNTELPESALIEKALEDPVADESPAEASDIATDAKELDDAAPSTDAAAPSENKVGDEYKAFYHDPVELEGSEPGQLFRSDAVRNPANTLDITNVGPYKAQRILYSVSYTHLTLPTIYSV